MAKFNKGDRVKIVSLDATENAHGTGAGMPGVGDTFEVAGGGHDHGNPFVDDVEAWLYHPDDLELVDEPATAPSVEQIAEVLNRAYGGLPRLASQAAEKVRALWSPAPGDADEARGHLREIYDTLAAAGAPRSGAVEMAKWAATYSASQCERAEKAEALVATLEGQVASYHTLADRLDREGQHLRAALEAADEAGVARGMFYLARNDHRATKKALRKARVAWERASINATRARKAVAAEGEARDE